MKVSLNGQEIDLFTGATVRDGLQRLSPQELRAVEQGEKRVYDRWGNEVALDGELSGGERLEVR